MPGRKKVKLAPGAKNTARDTSREPYIDNYPPLKEWLVKHKARCDWQSRIGGEDGNLMVEGWRLPTGRSFVVMVWGNGNGWAIHTDSTSVKTVDYLDDTEIRLGISYRSKPMGRTIVGFKDPQGIVRAWGIAPTEAEAREIAQRELGRYRTEKRALGDFDLAEATYVEEVREAP